MSQNPYAERLIGTLRRDCLDHVLIFGARHLRRVLTYSRYYNQTRTHLSLDKDAPLSQREAMANAERSQCHPPSTLYNTYYYGIYTEYYLL